jgi:hypothetical protein
MTPPPDLPLGQPPPAPPPPPTVGALTPLPGRTGPNPWLTLVVGLIVGLVVGGGGGYLLFHNGGTPVATTGRPVGSPSPSTSSQATPTATSLPSASASAIAQGVVACPVSAPADQHALGNPGAPSGGRTANPSLDFCGRGSATLPPGGTRFTTGANWEIGTAVSCPQGTSGEGGMGTVLTLTEVLPDGSTGPDSFTAIGDWLEDGGTAMATAGNYRLQVTAAVPGCVWHFAIYTP